MAHIGDLMVGKSASSSNLTISREVSPAPSPLEAVADSIPEDKEKYVWRMHQPIESRKYQLFPAKDKLSISPIGKSPDTEAMLPSALEKERAARPKPKEQTLVRRRKVSVPELGPMTTVQEIAMDSPTIPGRPPVHERSISAPGNSWRQHMFGESMISCISGPALDENAEMAIFDSHAAEAAQIIRPGSRSLSRSHSRSRAGSRTNSPSPKLPSPKRLSPLVIPSSTAPPPQRLHTTSSYNRLRSSTTPPEVPPKSARMTDSPFSRASPYTPSSGVTLSTAPTSISNTPVSAPERPSSPKPWISIPGRSSPKPWSAAMPGRSSPKPSTRTSSPKPWTITIPGRSSPKPKGQTSPTQPWIINQAGRSSPKPQQPHIASAIASSPPSNPIQMPVIMGHHRGQSQSEAARPVHTHTHRRGDSESTVSIMDRGRPKKRHEGSPIAPRSGKRAATPTLTSSEERVAFETLPQGIRATHASILMATAEIEALRKQAVGQASRFEVLNSRDVEALSRELRALDERCEYLRKTHRSLRSGRRNLHDRICTYLRSPRVAKFSHDSLLKQEEALSELDASIDDWVSKLEQAENRRTRVRQKLLEHVAAALIMKDPREMRRREVEGEDTPPRSPVKSSSPVALVEVREMEEVLEEEKADREEVEDRERERKRRDVESIRIYADSDVYALLADVEDEITRMGQQSNADAISEADVRALKALKSPVLLTSMTFSMPIKS